MNHKSHGFTIIEVLIVLAIGGLIMSIALLAIPNAQRNARNTQRRNDATLVLQAFSSYRLSNSGRVPVGNNPLCSPAALGSDRCPNTHIYDTAVSDAPVWLNYSSVVRDPTPTSTDAYSGAGLDPGIENLFILNWAKCSSDGTVAQRGGSIRSIVAVFRVETRTGTAPQCIELD